MTMETKWITDVSEIPAASDESLKMSLLTIDGRGRALKTVALEELLKRAREVGLLEGIEKGYDKGIEAERFSK
jgi:hypothetical protein